MMNLTQAKRDARDMKIAKRDALKDQYEVLDVNGDLKVDEDIEWEGDDGLSCTWTMYHKYPSITFVDSFCTRLEMAAEETEISCRITKAPQSP